MSLRRFDGVLRDTHGLGVQHGFPVVFITPTMNTFFLPDGEYWREVMHEVAVELEIPILDTTRLVQEAERQNGLVVETTEESQQLIQYRDGKPTILLDVPFRMPAEGPHISRKIFSYMDDNPDVRPFMSIDSNHLNVRGHEYVAGYLHRLLLEKGLLPE